MHERRNFREKRKKEKNLVTFFNPNRRAISLFIQSFTMLIEVLKEVLLSLKKSALLKVKYLVDQSKCSI